MATSEPPAGAARVVAFVHAKGSSQRVPAKNLRTLGDRPLFCHAIANALGCELVAEVVIDSDSPEILELGAAAGATPLRRPAALATNAATGDDLVHWQASNRPTSEIVLQVIPTSPFLRPATIDAAIRRIDAEGVDSVVGARSEVVYLWQGGRPAYQRPDGSIPNSFELPPIVYETTGLYVTRTRCALVERKRVSPTSCALHELSRIESIDINTEEDFEFAEIVWRGLRAASG